MTEAELLLVGVLILDKITIQDPVLIIESIFKSYLFLCRQDKVKKKKKTTCVLQAVVKLENGCLTNAKLLILTGFWPWVFSLTCSIHLIITCCNGNGNLLIGGLLF